VIFLSFCSFSILRYLSVICGVYWYQLLELSCITQDSSRLCCILKVGFVLDQVLIKFVDFGDCAVISVQNIRLLPTRFQQLPCLAINAQLGGVYCFFS